MRVKAAAALQCECARPVPHMPQELGWPVQVGAASPPPLAEAKTESFFVRRWDWQCGQGVPSQCVERTSTSLSFPQSVQ